MQKHTMKQAAVTILCISTIAVSTMSGTVFHVHARNSTATTTVTDTVAVAGPRATGLHVQGTQILDVNNRPFVLHGANRSGTEFACVQGPNIADGPVDASSVRAMATWHINAVRIPLNEDCWLGINGVAVGGTVYQQFITNWVTTVTQNGMVAVLDLHWSAPGQLMAKGQQPMADADHSPAFWSSVASAFKRNGNVVFDLYNEPYPNSNMSNYPNYNQWLNAMFSCLRDGCTVTATQGMSYRAAGMQQLVNAVRSTGATNLIMVGGVQYAQTVTLWPQYKPVDPLNNLAVSLHSYDHAACSDVACWNGTVAPVAQRYPVITGEFGETDCNTLATYTQTLLPWLDAHNVSYLAWTWDTDFQCQALISSYTGTATQSYGQAYQSHLASIWLSQPTTVAPIQATVVAPTQPTPSVTVQLTSTATVQSTSVASVLPTLTAILFGNHTNAAN